MSEWVLFLIFTEWGYKAGGPAMTSQPGFTRESCVAAVKNWRASAPGREGYCVERIAPKLPLNGRDVQL